MSLVLCFDFGMKYIGVASGQLVTKTANALTSLKARDGIPNKQELDALIKEWQPSQIVVGLPLNMDGTEQRITHAAKKFGNRLKEQYKLPTHFEDERLTSWEVKNTENSANFDKVNAEAARIILQQWLNSQTPN